MSPSPQDKDIFMSYLGPHASRRDVELQQSEVRAHAASYVAKTQQGRSRSRTRIEDVNQALPTQNYELSSNARDAQDTILKQFKLKPERDQLSLRQYVKDFIPGYSRLEAVLNVSNLRTIQFLNLLKEPDFYPIGIALFPITTREPINASHTELYYHDAKLLGKAIAALRTRIENNKNDADDVTLMCTAYLACLALKTSDTDAFAIHVKRLEQSINIRGGIQSDTFERSMKSALKSLRDEWLLNGNRSSVNIDMQEFTAHRVSIAQIFGGQPDSARLPSGFHQLVDSQAITQSVIQVLRRFNRALRTPDIIFDGDQALLYYISQVRRYSSVLEALPDLCPPELASTADLTLSRLISMALVLACCHFFFAVSNAPEDRQEAAKLFPHEYSMLRKRLVNELLHMNTAAVFQDNANTDALVWVFAVAVDSCALGNARYLPEGVELVSTLRRLYPARIPDLNSLQTVLTMFFCSAGMLEACRDCWTEQ